MSKKHPNYNQKYYDIPKKAWKNYLQTIGDKHPDLHNLILIVVGSNDCPPCLKELSWWNNHARDFKQTQVKVIVMEKYHTTFRAFVNQQELTLPVYQDSASLIVEKQLVPVTPIKLYFNDRAKLVEINKVGANGNLAGFVKEITTKKP